MKSVSDIGVFKNIPILLRASLNVPVENGKVVDDYRLRRALTTIRFLTEREARVVLISHLGEKGTETLKPVADALAALTPNVSFFSETVGPRARAAVHDLLPGHVLVMENLRRNSGEVKNTPAFAGELAEFADAFVQDAFDTCHRQQASIVGVPTVLPSYAGLLLEEEVRELTHARTPLRESLAIIGGAKFSTKETVLTTLLDTYAHVFVGGALASDFLKASGYPVGKSLVSGGDESAIKKMLESKKLLLPVDSLVVPAGQVGEPGSHAHARVAALTGVGPDEVILDHGPQTVALLATYAKKAKTILWNGPLGNYENGFTDATVGLARAIADSGAHSVVGGGDTIAVIDSLGLLEHFSFVSTGGGSMLDFLAEGTLPGIDALR
jgi:phosphoglycerate kinase